MGKLDRTVKIKTTDGQSMSVSCSSLPITIIYEYEGKQKIYTLKATKNDKLLLNWFVLIRAVNF